MPVRACAPYRCAIVNRRLPPLSATMNPATEVRRAALDALVETDPAAKAAAVAALHAALSRGAAAIDAGAAPDEPDGVPGRPCRPTLVAPRQLARRSTHTAQGRAVLLHALAHIEFNAINLALDAIWRFAAMPTQFYADWLRVAAEETQHFALLTAHLRDGYRTAYGDYPAHDGLWEMAFKTRGDVLARMALVPRTLEARGLDASPPLRDALRQSGDDAAAGILQRILDDEIGHVAIGNHWFRWLCARDGVDPHAAYPLLAARYRAPRPKGPFNLTARRAAGFDEREIAALGDG